MIEHKKECRTDIDDLDTVASPAKKARDGQTVSTLSTDYMKAAVDADGKLDRSENQVLDTNSLMLAFEDYVQKAIAGDCGVPINFFVKPITKRQLAKAWVNKYYPDEFIGANSGDDLSKGTAKSSNGAAVPETETA